jgi:hypothetical protein
LSKFIFHLNAAALRVIENCTLHRLNAKMNVLENQAVMAPLHDLINHLQPQKVDASDLVTFDFRVVEEDSESEGDGLLAFVS